MRNDEESFAAWMQERCEEPADDGRVAIKILHRHDEQSRMRFERESHILAPTRHPNTPRLMLLAMLWIALFVGSVWVWASIMPNVDCGCGHEWYLALAIDVLYPAIPLAASLWVGRIGGRQCIIPSVLLMLGFYILLWGLTIPELFEQGFYWSPYEGGWHWYNRGQWLVGAVIVMCIEIGVSLWLSLRQGRGLTLLRRWTGRGRQ